LLLRTTKTLRTAVASHGWGERFVIRTCLQVLTRRHFLCGFLL